MPLDNRQMDMLKKVKVGDKFYVFSAEDIAHLRTVVVMTELNTLIGLNDRQREAVTWFTQFVESLR